MKSIPNQEAPRSPYRDWLLSVAQQQDEFQIYNETLIKVLIESSILVSADCVVSDKTDYGDATVTMTIRLML